MAAPDGNRPKSALASDFVNPIDGPFIRFPPFPVPPQNTTIISFKEFKERGIRMEPGPDGVEVDGLGIPTVPLPKRHNTDVCKTNTKRKQKSEETTLQKKPGAPAVHVVWWKEWEETEKIRFSHAFNPNSTRIERIHAAAGDFTTGRGWPDKSTPETGPRYIWERFQRYIGIPEGGVVPKEKKKVQQEDEDSDISDDDMDDNEDGGLDEVTDPTTANIFKDSNLAGVVAKNKAVATNETNLVKFFDNPEQSIKVFMSSHARAKGYIWSDVNVACMPRVLYFFVNFLLRSKVLPESERSLRRAVEVIQVAQIELPNISRLARNLPDQFSRACKASWGKKSEGYKLPDPEDAFSTSEEASELKVEVRKSGLKLEDKHDSGLVRAPWNSVRENKTPWPTSDAWGPAETSTEQITKITKIWMLLTNEETLGEELGLTALLSTHHTGVVERSMRRIKTISGPNPNPPKPAQAEGSSETKAETVEIDLDSRFTKVVLSPMPVNWDGGEHPVYSRPAILKTSQGAVVEPGVPIPKGTTPRPHDPLNDEITLLIESDEAKLKLLREGMLLSGLWVQIVRQGEREITKNKKKKGKSKKSAPVYWYLDELAIILPSFWAISVNDQESD